MEYKVVGGVKYKKNNYLILMNNRLDKYYVGVGENGELIPLELKEYLELKDYIFRMKNKNNSGVMVGDKLNINPMVRIGKKLVPLVLATNIIFSLNGCGNNKNSTINELSKNGIEVTQVDNSKNLYFIDSIHTDLIKDNNSINIEKDYFGDLDIDVTCLPSELNQYLNYGETTWDDIINIIKNNKSINDELEKLLIQGINNLDKEKYNYDLTTLRYNLENIKIEYCEDSELPDNWGGLFDPYECSIQIGKSQVKTEKFKHILFHEIIGHGSQEAYVKTDKQKILSTNSSYYIVIESNGNISDAGKFGNSFNESFADVMACSLKGEKLDCELQVGYPSLDYYCNTVINSCNGNYSNYVNNGTEYLTEIMTENNIKDPYECITYSDLELYAINCSDGNIIPYTGEYVDTSFVYIINQYIKLFIDGKLKEGYSKDEVYDYVSNLIKSNDDLIKYINMNNDKVFYSYTQYGEFELINKKDILLFAEEYIYGSNSKKK
ncbi:MAG: hypothetical protein VZS44_00580 [Bacilli bacterium]|nr:hypothetical protein [Bacilli bacterium]